MILAGDYTDHSRAFWFCDFALWLNETKDRAGQIIGIGGNHDFDFRDKPILPEKMNWIYLNDSGCNWNGINIYGSPYSKTFGSWAFMESESELEQRWKNIPDNTNILIVHGPPFGYGDMTERGERVGSESLTERIQQIRPKWVVTGHIHEAYGRYRMGGTTVINAAHCDVWGRPKNYPIPFEW